LNFQIVSRSLNRTFSSI